MLPRKVDQTIHSYCPTDYFLAIKEGLMPQNTSLHNTSPLVTDDRLISHHQIGIFTSTALCGIRDTSLDASAARAQVTV